MIEEKMTENYIVDRVISFMENKENGNWHHEKTVKADLHTHGVDIKLVGGKRNSEYFFIECKGRSYAKIVTRINVKRYTLSKNDKKINGINHAYKYGLGLYWESAQVALRRIPREVAEVLCLHIFAVNDNGVVKYFTPSKFGVSYTKEYFD